MSELKYTNDHECIYLENDTAWIGITDYAREALGDLVYVDLPEIGKTIQKGEDFAVVESVKTAAEVYSPVNGEIIEINESMPDDLELISKPLKDGGWIAKIKVSDLSQLDGLMNDTEYQAYLKTLD